MPTHAEALVWRYDDSLARRAIAAGYSARTEHELPELVAARAECGGRGGKVEAPHAPEAFAVLRRECRPGGVEIRTPGHQGPVVVGAEVVPVLDHEHALARSGDLFDRRQHGIGKNILCDPRVGTVRGHVAADAMQ